MECSVLWLVYERVPFLMKVVFRVEMVDKRGTLMGLNLRPPQIKTLSPFPLSLFPLSQ